MFRRLALLWCCLPAAAPAQPLDQMLDVGLSAGYACAADTRRYHGLAVELDVLYAFSALWAVRALAGHAEHSGKGQAFRVERLGAALRFQLDVFEYVPWLEVAPTLYVSSGEVGPADGAFGIATGFGFDRLLSPTWSVGVGGAYHQVIGEARFPAYFHTVLRVGHRWVLGDPFAP